jgi:thiol-disulfide isomerase/thioredoxin
VFLNFSEAVAAIQWPSSILYLAGSVYRSIFPIRINLPATIFMVAVLFFVSGLSASVSGLNHATRFSHTSHSLSLSMSNAWCPFCAALNATFAEQIAKHEISVVAKLVAVPPKTEELATEFPRAKFEIVSVLKGEAFVAPGMVFQTQLVGTYPVDEKFLVMGVEPPQVMWSTPMQASDRVIEYLTKSQKLPASGPVRLAFFQQYFEDPESTLAFDAFDEFAIADYADLIAFKDGIKKEKLIQWIGDPELRVDRRRLYFTMLGVCGTAEDIEFLKNLILSEDPQDRAGLDALLASYLTLAGESGVPLIEDTFLKKKGIEDPEINAAISALRFHGTEVKHIPRDRIAQAVRLALDHPKLADTVIPDLARWEDWSVVDRMVDLFKNCDEDYQYIRVPVVAYLTACPKPEAKAYLKELEKIDPDAVRRARFFMGDYGDDEDEDGDEQGDPTDEASGNKKANDPGSEGEERQGLITAPAANRSDNSSEENLSQLSSIRQGALLSGEWILTGTTSFLTSAAANHEFDVDQPSRADTNVLSGRSTETAVDELEDQRGKSSAPMPVSAQKTETSMVPPNREETRDVTNSESNLAAVPNAAAVGFVSARSVTWLIIFVPVGFSFLIFVLIWSVVHGWFERLIF